MDFIVNKYVDLEKRLIISEYKMNKDKKKIKRITNDLYEEDNTIDKQDKPIETQDKPIIIDDDFENKVKGIIDDNKNTENEKQDDNQQFSPSFEFISKRRK
jgi:hypothetical protein